MVLLESIHVPLGSDIIDFALKGTDDKIHKLSEFKNKKAIVIVFTCNHCPYAQAVWGRIIKLSLKFRDKGVQFITINPNIHPDYPEDSFENMKHKAKELSIDFPYLVDETQEVADKYQAQCTPDIYVYDKKGKLAYHGRIDDNWKDELSVTSHDLYNALRALVNGKKIQEEQLPAMGCSIKWREK